VRTSVMCTLLAVLGIAGTASANPPSTFRITELFSNQDGSVQFIRLTESAGVDDEDDFQNLTITVSHQGIVKTFTFPSQLPTPQTAHRSVVIGVAPDAQIGDGGFGPAIFGVTSCCGMFARPDFVMPARFLPTDGGAVDFAGIDTITYSGLPTDGANALYADGTISTGVLPPTYCPGPIALGPLACPADMHPSPTLITAVEFYNAAQDRYFSSASAPDIDALDSGRLPGWQRTGESFEVAGSATARLGLEYEYNGLPVCRFYIPPAQGDSHFLSASADECAAVRARFPEFILESPSAFHAALPIDAGTGQCGVMPGIVDGDIPLFPVFRLWNGRADSNHRYTTSLDTRAAMIARGWVSEGAGPLGVVMCVP